MEGAGEMHMYFRETYRGDFHEGLRHGLGEQLYANGDRYIGTFLAKRGVGSCDEVMRYCAVMIGR